ncbi:unnamed protein product [Peniophora sp. CBMAI 1063]|nr:unnamed protein product [Peniophora sp. CBMAI 1063]
MLTSWLQYAALALASVHVASATQAMGRPANVNKTISDVDTASKFTTKHVSKRASAGKVSMSYYPNWAIYSALNFPPTEIDASKLSHIIYSFADAQADSGTVILTDSWADEQIHYDGDSWSDTGNNLYGCLKRMYLLKLANRNLKVLLSVGGWTYTNTDHHFDSITSASWRSTFVSSAVQLVKDYGFDGIDIDYEYPSTAAQGQGFADLLTELRTAFTALQTSNGDSVPYQITVAVAAGLSNAANYVVPQMDKAIDYWNLMAYDYSGSFSTVTAPQANVYGGELTGFSTDKALTWYLGQGATASKIVLGMPAYGHAFEGTTGLGATYTTTVADGTIDVGIYAYKQLPLSGATVYENSTDISSYSYDASKKELVSYDTPNIVKKKAQYVLDNSLAGSMFWDLATDTTGDSSLMYASASVLGSLDTTQNHINYPSSKWDNIKNNMGQSSSTTPTSSAPATTTTSGSGSGSGSCASVAAWSSSTIYTAGMTATYNGSLYTAKWWTQGDLPTGTSGAWALTSAC